MTVGSSLPKSRSSHPCSAEEEVGFLLVTAVPSANIESGHFWVATVDDAT